VIVVFDLNGVLFDWQPARLIADVLPQRARGVAEGEHCAHAYFQSYGGDGAEFDRGTIEVDALVPRIAARTGLTEAEVQAVVDAVPGSLRPRADTVALLRRLRDDGHRVHYLSNMPAPYADHLEQVHAFMRWFESGVFSSRVRLVKPERAIFDTAAERLAIDLRQAVFFDDHRPNVDAARGAGWRALHFTDAAAAAAALQPLLDSA
jgi:HAD superfamily hydrolase (TIGR01509 family)